MSQDKKVFRCPIHQLIEFDRESILLRIINSREFQRLRRIRQLGLSGITYPSSTHDRFSHSLGVMHLAGKLIDNLKLPTEIEIENVGGIIRINKEQLKLLLQVTALLHDIGHGPFSHAFEKVTGTDHELLTNRLIDNDHGDLKGILDGINDPTLSKYLRTWVKEILDKTFRPVWIRELISSQLDADRLDYLKRDSYMCGVSYAEFDIVWLIRNMELREISNEAREGLVINASKGLGSVESFLISRYHMYEQVYFHKTTRGFEMLMIKILHRFNSLRKLNKLEINSIQTFGSELERFMSDNNDLNAFLSIDDFVILTHIAQWARQCKDELLKELCRCFMERDVYKMIKEEKNDQLFNFDSYSSINECFGDNKELRNYYFFEDSPANMLYKDNYLTGKATAEDAEHIWVINKNNKVVEVSAESILISSLRNEQIKKYRAYIKRDIFEKNKSILKKINALV